MQKIPKAQAFEFTTFRQSGDREFVFNYVVHFADGTLEKFSERLVVPFDVKTVDRTATAILRQIHLVLGINYYKLYAPKTVKVPYPLDSLGAEFWNKVYRYGLGEFAYKNGLSPHKLGNFRAVKHAEEVPAKPQARINYDGHYLTGIGGGKDSLVAWELLKRAGLNQTPFICESPSYNNVLRREVVQGLSAKAMICERQPDKKLEQLRKSGHVYRGHSPMSVIVAFVAVLCAYLKKYDGFLVANESSSNEYNLTWRGIKVNHQWTKTIYFEKSLNQYLQHINVPVQYLSVVRPMNELMITALFARMPEYHQTFFSCNRSLLDKLGKPRKWCGDCAKCASATLLLSPFLSPKQISGIIGRNMLAKAEYTRLFAELAGFAGDKPFECVCTKEEARAIIRHLHSDQRYDKLPVIANLYENYDDADRVNDIEDLLKFRPTKSYPATLARKLRKEIEQILED